MIGNWLAGVAMILVVSGSVYSAKYVQKQNQMIHDLETRVKTLEDKVFPPKKPAAEKTETKRSSKRRDKKTS